MAFRREEKAPLVPHANKDLFKYYSNKQDDFKKNYDYKESKKKEVDTFKHKDVKYEKMKHDGFSAGTSDGYKEKTYISKYKEK